MIRIPSTWIYVSWDELKMRSGLLDYLGKPSSEKECHPFKVDGVLVYYTTLTKSYSGTNDDDCKDFYDNYKEDIDTIIPELDRRADDGLITHYSSPRPANMTTIFAGVGDDTSTSESSGIGEGVILCFSLAASASSIYKDIEFQEDIYIKDGFMIAKNAPFGAYVDMDAVHPVAGKVASFIKKIPIYGDHPIYLNSEDRAKLQQGLMLRITVYNSNPDLYEEHDPPAAFKATGRIELFRATTS